MQKTKRSLTVSFEWSIGVLRVVNFLPKGPDGPEELWALVGSSSNFTSVDTPLSERSDNPRTVYFCL